MYINSTLGKTPKFLKKIDRSVRDSGKKVDQSTRRIAADVSNQYKRSVSDIQKLNPTRLIVPEGKTPSWLKSPERQIKRSVKQTLPYVAAYAGNIYGGPITAAQAGVHGKTRTRAKGAPGSIEREKYRKKVERAQKFTTVTTGAALAVVGGAAAYGAVGAGSGAASVGKIGAALTSASAVGDKINSMLDPFNPDAVANVPIPEAPANSNIPWIPLALAAGFLFL